MRWLAFLPLILLASVAAAGLAVTLLVEWNEAKRRRRTAPGMRRVFRPVIIQGGRSPAPPPVDAEPKESKIA